MSRHLNLLPPQSLLKTGDVDHADWNHRPIIGSIQRMRYRLALSLMGNATYGRLLEAGYGSGVFMPELSKRCSDLYGVDIHPLQSEVGAQLRRHDVHASLLRSSITELPFEDNSLDCVVTVSSLEFVEDIDAACREVHRVLAPGGIFVVITPGHSALVDFGLRMLTGENASRDFGQRRERILPVLKTRFAVERIEARPTVLHRIVHLYTGLRLGKRPDHKN